MKIFGITLKPLFRNTGASYTHRPERKRKVLDPKAIFAEGVELGRMLVGEERQRESKEHKRSRRRR